MSSLHDAEEAVRRTLRFVKERAPAIERRLQVVSNPAHEDWESWSQVAQYLREWALSATQAAEAVEAALPEEVERVDV